MGAPAYEYSESVENLTTMGRVVSPGQAQEILVVGSSQLFHADGQVRCVPMPTPDPKDPMNLPNWRKWLAIAALCFFGALALAAEAIIGGLVPVFMLEYTGIDPRLLGEIDINALAPPDTIDLDPLRILAGLGGPPLWKVSLLSSLPLLVNGIASYVLVPLSIAIGRRPVLLFAGLLAWVGGFWAAVSQSLDSHLAARCFQGFGAGAVEALIPLIIQDMMFINQRNQAFASIVSSQGFIIVGLGIATPSIVVDLSWRYLYWITSGVGVLAWIGIIAAVPETRWIRTPDELAGKEVYALRPGETRPRVDAAVFGPRTRKTDFGIFHIAMEWKLAGKSMVETVKTTFFPNVLLVILISSVFVSMQGAATQVGSSLLIAAGWKFRNLGLVVIPIVVATPFVWLFGGLVADGISNAMARRNQGRREPESHLISLIVPLVAGLAGPLLFGWAGEHIFTVSSWPVLGSIFLIAFGFLTATTLFSVYLVESYPVYAGPVLVNVASIRLCVGFAMSFKATQWIQDMGFFKSFAIYTGALALACLGLPVVYIYGKRIRAWTAGQLGPAEAVEEHEFDDLYSPRSAKA